MDGAGFWVLLAEPDQEALRAVARFRAFAPSAMLCTEGEPASHVFILLSGWVKIITVTREGKEMLVALRGEGDVIGDIAATVTGYRTASIQAIDLVQTLIVGATAFADFLDTHRTAAQAYRWAMAERQRADSEAHRSRVLASSEQRLARLLLDLTKTAVKPGGGATTTPLPLSQEEIASLLGASRSTVTRALHEWRSRGVIRTDQRRITVVDRPRLERLADRAQ